jgi:hypothetical protein
MEVNINSMTETGNSTPTGKILERFSSLFMNESFTNQFSSQILPKLPNEQHFGPSQIVEKKESGVLIAFEQNVALKCGALGSKNNFRQFYQPSFPTP